MLRFTTSAVALLIAGPAFASGYVAPPPPPVIVPVVEPDWTGPYAGIQLDYIIEGSALPEDDDDGSVDLDGHLIGIFGGYRYDLGDFVIGGEIDYMIGSGEASFAQGNLDIDYNALLRAGVEVGFDLGDALLYGTAGYAWVEIDANVTDDSSGYFAGVGVDYRVSERVTVGAELLYHEFSDFSSGPTEIDLTTIGVNVAFTF